MSPIRAGRHGRAALSAARQGLRRRCEIGSGDRGSSLQIRSAAGAGAGAPGKTGRSSGAPDRRVLRGAGKEGDRRLVGLDARQIGAATVEQGDGRPKPAHPAVHWFLPYDHLDDGDRPNRPLSRRGPLHLATDSRAVDGWVRQPPLMSRVALASAWVCELLLWLKCHM